MRLQKEAEKKAKEAATKKQSAESKKSSVQDKDSTAPVLTPEELAAKEEEEKHKAAKKKSRVGETAEAEDEESAKSKHKKRAGRGVKKADVPDPKKGVAALIGLDVEPEVEGILRPKKRKRSSSSGNRVTIKVNNRHGFKKPTEKVFGPAYER